MKLAYLVAATLFVSPAMAEPTKIKAKDALSAINALVEIGKGQQHVIKDGGVDKIAIEQFDLSDSTKTAIAKDIFRLSEAYTPVQKEYAAAIRALCPNGAEKLPDGTDKCKDKREQVEAETETFYNRFIEVDIIQLSEADLKLGKNAISPNNLAGLGIIIPTIK